MLSNRKGFTLIELVIIIVILGILAAVAVPKYYDLTTDAKTAACNGAKGALMSSAGIMIAMPTTAGVKAASRGTAATRAEVIAYTAKDGWSAAAGAAAGVVDVTLTGQTPAPYCSTSDMQAAGLTSD